MEQPRLHLEHQGCRFHGLGLVESGDWHCMRGPLDPPDYDSIGENSPYFDRMIAEVNGVEFHDIEALDREMPDLPTYIPTVQSGSRILFERHQPTAISINLADVVSDKLLQVTDDIHKPFGIPPGTAVILQGFSMDGLLERVWPRRREVIEKLAKLKLVAATAFDYSIYGDNPHAERLINLKRNMITFAIFQELGGASHAAAELVWPARP